MLRQQLLDEPLPYPPNIPLLIQQLGRVVDEGRRNHDHTQLLTARAQQILAQAQAAIERSRALRAQQVDA